MINSLIYFEVVCYLVVIVFILLVVKYWLCKLVKSYYECILKCYIVIVKFFLILIFDDVVFGSINFL